MITNLRVQKFRSYGDGSFEFEPGVNIIVGPNASGKTNLLEAVLVLAQGSSYRARDAEMMMFGKSWYRLDGRFDNSTRTIKTTRSGETTERQYEIDGKVFRRLPFSQTIPVVYFEPNHLQLIARGPDQRRDYFDELLIQTDATIKNVISGYKRTLAQRNSLLKRGRLQAQNQLFAWDIRLAQLGEKIVLARHKLSDDANRSLTKTYSQVAKKKTKLTLEYKSQLPPERYSSRLLQKLEANLETDLERGFTGFGPHRDDFIFYLNDHPANAVASRGETRSILLALKVFELKQIEKSRGQPPIFLLDDVFSELDGSRRHALVDFITDYQAIITTTDADSVVNYFDKKIRPIALSPTKK
jgi:DNA replication and repair protein RecF